MSHYSGRYSGEYGYSSYTPSYSSFDSYSSRKYSYYTPRTYDFGTSSFLSKNYGSSEYYTRRYDEYSWKAKDLMTNNPANDEVIVERKESTRERYKFDSITESQDKEELVVLESKEDKSPKKNSVDYLRDYSRRDNLGDYSSRKVSSEHEATRDYVIMGSKRKKYMNVDSNGLDHNSNFLENEKNSTKKGSSLNEVGSSVKNLSLRDDKEKTTRKKTYDESDDDVFIKPENEKILQSGKDSIFDSSKRRWWNDKSDNNSQTKRGTPQNTTTSTFKSTNLVEQPKSKSASDITDSAPLRMHPQRVAKFISVIPDQNRYVSSVKFLPNRIELRFIGAPAMEKKVKRCRSITDLYEITIQPNYKNEKPPKRGHPWEETIQCQKQEMAYTYDSENEILHYTKSTHEHTKEMYISQYTHHFDPEEPRTHIAGWKVDVEPNGIPHERSRMCVMRSPVVSDSRRRVARPKSAPPKLFRSVSPVESVQSQEVEAYERAYYTVPRRKNFHEHFFQTSVDESMTEDTSSVGYAPSEDTSDSSAFFTFNAHQRYYYENYNKDPNFGFNKPRLIRLSAEFPGIRNLEKMRRKRQSMGSYSLGGSRSSVGHSPSPRNGEYGFFVALTSGDPRQPNSKRQHRYSHYY